MPVQVLFFRDDRGRVVALDWIRDQPKEVRAKLLVGLKRLETYGADLRRPHADLLRDGIHELRISHRRAQYRLLYFLSGRDVVVVSNGTHKERIVPPSEIERAIAARKAYERAPLLHSVGSPP